jgi:hypothetical protein
MGSGVAEWCGDWYVVDPTLPKERDPKGPDRSTSRVVRGHEPEAFRRKGVDPDRRESVGLRCAMELK